MKIKYLILILALPLALAQAETATPADTGHCPQTTRWYVEGEALVQMCSVYTQRIPEDLQHTARTITDRLEQCSKDMSAEQVEAMLQQLEQEPQLAAIRTVAGAEEESARQNWCQNAEQRLLQLLTQAQSQYGKVP